jgi:hypothetical protein
MVCLDRFDKQADVDKADCIDIDTRCPKPISNGIDCPTDQGWHRWGSARGKFIKSLASMYARENTTGDE